MALNPTFSRSSTHLDQLSGNLIDVNWGEVDVRSSCDGWSKSKNGECTDIEVWNASMFIRGLR